MNPGGGDLGSRSGSEVLSFNNDSNNYLFLSASGAVKWEALCQLLYAFLRTRRDNFLLQIRNQAQSGCHLAKSNAPADK